MKKFADWVKEQQTQETTDTGQIATFARPFLTGGERRYPEPLTVDNLEKKKKHERKAPKNL